MVHVCKIVFLGMAVLHSSFAERAAEEKVAALSEQVAALQKQVAEMKQMMEKQRDHKVKKPGDPCEKISDCGSTALDCVACVLVEQAGVTIRDGLAGPDGNDVDCSSAETQCKCG